MLNSRMLRLRAYKTELDPNQKTRTLLLQHPGARRWAYNWGLRRKIEEYEQTGHSPNAQTLHRELNRLKKLHPAQGGVPWMYEVSKCAPQEALRDLDEAFRHFFRRVRNGEKPGFPKFKTKKKGIGGFRLTGRIQVLERHIILPRLGRIRLKERGYLPFDNPKVHILSATVREQAGRWTVSLQVEEDVEPPDPPAGIGGVDLGIRSLATLSDGTAFENPRPLAKAQRRLKRLQRSVSRKKKGSKNRKKAVRKLARGHARIAHLRKSALHQISAAIFKRFGVVGAEDLALSAMGETRSLARALQDGALGELHRQIAYKVAWQGGRLVLVDRFYPSSKTCSGCGAVKETLGLGERIYQCQRCGLLIDRDYNAAINLRNVAARETETRNACGGGKLQAGNSPCPSEKQEPNAKSGRVQFG
jgi:putative transposase